MDLVLEGFKRLLPKTSQAILVNFGLISIGFMLLTTSIFTLTWNNPPIDKVHRLQRDAWNFGTILRLAIAPSAIYFFLAPGWWPNETAGAKVNMMLAVIGMYGAMRVLETTLVGLMDNRPPHWIVGGKEVPLPTTVLRHLAYLIDLTTSMRGNSWFLRTHWDWAPKALVNSLVRLMSRT